MTMVTTWWQTVNARKGRLAELETQLRHERLLRDEAVRRTAMLELVYTLRRFVNTTMDAEKHHEHNKKLSMQVDSPIIADLIPLGQAFTDLLDKNASLVDGKTRNTLECIRDRWQVMYCDGRHFSVDYRDNVHKECCLLGGDFQILEITTCQGIWALEHQLDAMRFT